MKITKLAYFFVFVGLFFLCCKNDNKSSYAISDFDNKLRPYLVEVVSKGIVGFDTASKYIQLRATDEELNQLSKSEHPVLRALAFRTMLERKTFNHFDIIMNNLDDSAIVATDAGEWGIRYLKIADDILQNGKWKDTLAKNETIELVILKHNHLRSAFDKISDLKLRDIYYPYIKEMAQRERPYEGLGGFDFSQTENALYALAKFKKREDIPIIKQLLLSHCSEITETSFALMKEYPDESYLEVYEHYYPRKFYRRFCRDQNFNEASGFINSIASYKNKRSEKILDSMLNRKPFMPCAADTSYLKYQLIYAIWNNPCEAYKKLRMQVEPSINKEEKEKKENISISPAESVKFQPDTSSEPVRWWWDN